MPAGEASEPPAQPGTPVPAATVMLVRDGAAGVEVFLMERSGFGAFGGLHVFPGGKLDGADYGGCWGTFAHGIDDAEASRRLGLDRDGLAYWVACIRECFEEAGVLLATREGGALVTLADPERRRRFASWRERLNAGGAGVFEAMCTEEGLRLAADQLAYVSHWITPIEQPKRYNTRFFVARAPAEQDALHDGFETVESDWLRPETALARFRAGELNLISPTLANLEALCGFATTQALLEAKRAVDPATIPMILPRVSLREGGGFDEAVEVVGRGGQSFTAN